MLVLEPEFWPALSHDRAPKFGWSQSQWTWSPRDLRGGGWDVGWVGVMRPRVWWLARLCIPRRVTPPEMRLHNLSFYWEKSVKSVTTTILKGLQNLHLFSSNTNWGNNTLSSSFFLFLPFLTSYPCTVCCTFIVSNIHKHFAKDVYHPHFTVKGPQRS